MVGISVPIAGKEESKEGRVVSIAGSERSGAADDPTERRAESNVDNPVSSKESVPSNPGIVVSIAGRDDSIESVTFGVSVMCPGSSLMPLTVVCWDMLVSTGATSTCAASTWGSFAGAGSWFEMGFGRGFGVLDVSPSNGVPECETGWLLAS